MAFSADQLGRTLRGVFLIGLLATVASCSKTTVAGVVLKFETDGTLSAADRVYRAGALNDSTDALYPWLRNSNDPYAQGPGGENPGQIGIRCARAP